MCLVRLKQEGVDGKRVIGMMNNIFWIDVGDRIDMMGRIDARVVIDNKRQLARHFYGVILAYDEVCIIWDIVIMTTSANSNYRLSCHMTLCWLQPSGGGCFSEPRSVVILSIL